MSLRADPRRIRLLREAVLIVLLGPFWGTLMTYFTLTGVVVPSALSPRAVLAFFPIALLAGYVVGIGPALLTGVLHYALRVRTWMRFLISPAIGFVASPLPMIVVPQLTKGATGATWAEAATFGIVGMLSTLISIGLARLYGDGPPPLAAAQPDIGGQDPAAAASRIAGVAGPGDRGAPGGAAAA